MKQESFSDMEYSCWKKKTKREVVFTPLTAAWEQAGRTMRGGSIVDATLISAPSSTKNTEKK